MYGTSMQPKVHFDGSSVNMFGSPPFAGHKRRKRGDLFARLTTKAVLLSPVVILSIWSIAVMFSSSKTPQQMPLAQAVRVPVRPNAKQAQRIPLRPHHMGVVSQFSSSELFANAQHRPESIIQPAHLREQSQPYVTSDSDPKSFALRPRPHPRNVHDAKILPVYDPLGGSQNSAERSVGQLGLSDAESNTMAESDRNELSAVQNSVIQMGNTASNINAMLSSAAMSSTQDSMTSMMMTSDNLATNERMGSSIIEGKMLPVINPLGKGDLNVIVRPRPKPRSVSKKTTILYYDPDASMMDGQLYLPDIVYDENGTEIDLLALQAVLGAEVFMEPPPLENSPINTPAQKLSRQEIERYVVEPPVQDQYIIIATVAVMALLVGALSARRLRSRNFLSSCIENEALEEEVAYDVATTNGDYSTFAGNTMFRGDLEKFDV